VADRKSLERRDCLLGRRFRSKRRDGLTGGMEAVYSRVMMLLEQAIRAPEKTAPRMPANPRRRLRPRHRALRRQGQIGNIVRKLYHLCCQCAALARRPGACTTGRGVLERGRSYRPQMETCSATRGNSTQR